MGYVLQIILGLFGYTVLVCHSWLNPGQPDELVIRIFKRDWKKRQEGRRYYGIDPKSHDYV